ncbi:hypothetical protein Tco_0289811 [Tanacetum coccineum]
MAIEVLQTLEYRGGQLNVVPLLEVENFTNWKKGSCATSLDFQDSLDDEEDTRSSQEYLNDLKEEYQTRALLAKSKKFFKKGSQRFSSAKATKILNATNVVEMVTLQEIAKLTLLSPGASASSSILVKNKGLIAETCEWDEEDVSSDDNEVMEVKALMALAEEERVSISKECTRNREWVQISIRKHASTEILKENKNLRKELNELKSITNTWLNSSKQVNQRIIDNSKASIPGVERPWLSEAEVAVIDSSETEYDSAGKSSVCSTFFPPLEKPGDAELVSRPNTVKTTLKSISTFKAEGLKGIIPNEPSSTPTQENK